jgi:hypothetical protein
MIKAERNVQYPVLLIIFLKLALNKTKLQKVWLKRAQCSVVRI